MRLVLLLLCIASIGHCFYLGNYYYAPRNTYESAAALHGEETGMNGDEGTQMVQKTKRLKPCFYSPIQCMFRRK